MKKSNGAQSNDIEPSKVREWTKQLFAGEPGVIGQRQLLRVLICPFEKLLPHIRPNSRLLDIGCGGGLFLGLTAMGAALDEGVGIDTSLSAILCARRMAERIGFPRLHFLQVSDIEGWPKEQFGMVSLIDVMHHVPRNQRAAFFKSAVLRVEDSGLLIFKDMRPTPKWRAAANVLHDLIVARQWVRAPHRSEVEAWARESGLDLISYDEWNRLCYGHALWVFRRRESPEQAKARPS